MNIFKKQITALSLAALVLLSSCTGTDNASTVTTDAGVAEDNSATGIFEEDFELDEDFSYLTVTDDATGWDSTIKYSNSAKNGIDLKYDDPQRSAVAFSNTDFSARFGLTDSGSQLITSFANKNGNTYFTNSSDVYLTNSSDTFFASRSSSQGYLNSFRMGYYYYDIHFMGLSVSAASNDGSNVRPYDLIGGRGNWLGNDTYDVSVNDGTLKYKVKSNIDPYCFRTGIAVPTERYNAIKITLSSQNATSCQLFIFTDEYEGFNAQQVVSFPITPGEEKSYTVGISGLPGYSGSIRGVRIDCGTVNEEIITVSSMQAIYDNSLSSTVRLERIYHTYPDKLHEEVRFIATSDLDDLQRLGVQTVIPADTVRKFVFGNDDAVYTSLNGDALVGDMTFVAFDIDQAGIYGYILPKCENAGSITVELKDGNYIVSRYITASSLAKDDELRLSHRIYNDTSHTFDDFLRQMYSERHPLESADVTKNIDGASYLGYDTTTGAYVFKLNGTDFSNAYYNEPDKYYKAPIEITGDDCDRRIYVKTFSNSGGLECGAVIDENEGLLPIPVQVCKNFHGEFEEPVYYPDDASYGEVYFPITVKANETKRFTVLNIYQNWGNYPLKQLSSIQFFAPYYHLSLGVTETNCIAPYFVNGKDAWTLPDFRALSSPLWTTQPQHHSAGQIFFLNYTDQNGNLCNSEMQSDKINSAGPIYADIDMDYLSDDGNIKVEYKHVELPQTDETRTMYQVKMTVLQDVTFNDFKKDFSFVSMNGRNVFYTKLSYLDEASGVQTKTLDFNSRFEEYIKLGEDAPFFCYYMRNGESTEVVNMALIVKDHDITIGGKKYNGGLLLKNANTGGLNLGALTLDLEGVTLKKGDVLSLDLILLPWGSYDEATIDSVMNVREDTALAPYKISVLNGEDISQEFLPCVKCNNGNAEFTVSCGDNIAAVRVYGFKTYEKPQIYELVNGEYTPYNVSKNADFEGYQVYLDDDGTYSFSFAVDMSSASDRTFKITQE